jgi:hypothetical protein
MCLLRNKIYTRENSLEKLKTLFTNNLTVYPQKFLNDEPDPRK